MFTVNDLKRLLDSLKADGFGEAVVVFRSPHASPLGLKPGVFPVEGLIPSSVQGSGTALVIDNVHLAGPGEGRPLCVVACHPFNRRVRYVPQASGRYVLPPEPLGASVSDVRQSSR